ncbi:MAG: glycoside hydrolase family 9 protein [Leptolyngbyaceae bacterium]|nr:glycoside hydrolase family 9 protein [Leptolyngbyaceae bacterium]
MVNFSIINDWGQGFTGSLSITNSGLTALNGWTLEFEAPFEITNIWNAEIVSREGNRYVIRNASWNRAIAPDETITFGFNGANSNGVTIEPTNFQLNGVDAPSGGVSTPSTPEPAPEPVVEPAPELSISNTTVTEGADSHARFSVRLSEASSAPVTVEYATVAGTARAGSDFRNTSGTLTFNPGEVSKTVRVAVVDDQSVESDEQFELQLSNVTNASLRTAIARATVRDNDEAVAPPPPESNNESTAPLPPASADAPQVVFSVRNDWGSGFTADMEIVYSGTETLNGWTIEFDAPFQIANIWNANIVSQNGNHYVIEDAGWNGTLQPGQTVSFGFNGNGAAVAPSGYELNGEAIAPPPVAPPPVTPPPTDNTPDVPTDPSPPTEPTEPVDDSNDSGDPGDSGDSGDPIDSGNSGDSGDASDPSDPVDAGDPMDSGSPQQGDFNYGEALQKSLLFYEAQRSGPLPDDTRIEWRGDSAMNDGADVGIDLSGGYYDAGDHVKFGFPMASSMTMLSWGVVEYREAYERSGQLDEALDAIRWGTDYILRAHVTDSQGTREFWGQVGDGHVDHAYWGPAEEMRMNRPAFKIDRQNPGSDLAGESAAALAAASIIFRESDPAYADRLLDNAIQLFEFADQYRGRYSDAIPNAQSFYNSWSGYMDELSWSAAWLHRATGDRTYLDKAEQYYQGLNPQWTQNWDNKSYGAATLLAQATGKSEYRQDAEAWLDYWSNPSGGIQYTSGGLAWLDQWGSTRYSANTAFIAGVYSDTVNDYGDRYANFAENQIDYLLGDNPNNFSYMVGFGDNYALNPHHRSAHGGYDINDPNPNANTLYGALVGGPASPNDNDYVDVRSDYIRNEVALDYNAGLTGALVRLYGQFGGDPLTDTQLNNLPGISVSEF